MTTIKPSIAVIEDSADLREELSFFLTQKGYNLCSVGSAEAFWKQLHLSPADIVLIDIGLPGENGFNVVEQLGQMQNFGLIIISAHGSQEYNNRGLDSGADLYLVKPISFAHLVSSIDALWHRMQNNKTHSVGKQGPLERWILDVSNKTLTSPNDMQLKLSQQECNLVAALCVAPQEVLSKEQLHAALFKYEEDSDEHRIDVILNRLRKKAREQHFKLPIHSIFGKGVVFTGHLVN